MDHPNGLLFNLEDRSGRTGNRSSANFLRVTALSDSTTPRTGQIGIRFGF